jgi:Mlc titration factor MtfA (ptsG expression regulator)
MQEEKWKLCLLFSKQAINNFHECWAEYAELFFENPVELHKQYPELYNTIGIILNQDPLNRIKILRPLLTAWPQTFV